jgi:hypothetical protein
MTELTRQRVELGEAVHSVRQLELERLDLLQAAIWTDAMRGDLAAVGAVLAIMQKRSVLLGLHAPTKMVPATPPGAPSPPRAQTDGHPGDVALAAIAFP